MARWVAVQKTSRQILDHDGEWITVSTTRDVSPVFEAPDRTTAEVIAMVRYPSSDSVQSVAARETFGKTDRRVA
jgi:hypothetical protein